MITAQARMSALGQRLRRRAQALAERRAQAIKREARPADWRNARSLWPGFGED
ncbi:MAG: hypothetical protein ACXIUO_14895 [Erythrobacter sp.]